MDGLVQLFFSEICAGLDLSANLGHEFLSHAIDARKHAHQIGELPEPKRDVLLVAVDLAIMSVPATPWSNKERTIFRPNCPEAAVTLIFMGTSFWRC